VATVNGTSHRIAGRRHHDRGVACGIVAAIAASTAWHRAQSAAWASAA